MSEKIIFSIIIPTWGKQSKELLERLCPTIIEFSDLSKIEIIVSANGCTDDTKEYIASLGEPFKLVWNDEQLGYSKAINAGVKASQGQYLIFLNNDTKIMGGGWIDMLYAPFVDPLVAITGPMKTFSPETERLFLIFFCVMLRRNVFDQLGGLDEMFELGWGEDTHFCHQVEDQLDMKIVQIPVDAHLISELTRSQENPNIGVGNFPMYHEGGCSIAQLGKERGDAMINKNSALLTERYYRKANIKNALKVDGFISPEELAWLGQITKDLKGDKVIVCEIGSWKGRSSRAIADNLPPNGILICIDTFLGSSAEHDTYHIEGKLLDGDYIYDHFCRSLWDIIQTGKVMPLRMHSKYAAKLLSEKGLMFDLIFVDGGHLYHEVQEDINNFLPLLKEGGIICGHDFKQGLMPEVTPAVLDIFGSNVGHPENTTIWYTNAKPITPYNKADIYDCFTFFNELDVLEIRLNELYDVVDRFILVEASSTHQRESKPLYFKDNLERFGKFLHKVTHIVVDFPPEFNPTGGSDAPAGEDYWKLERYQRDRIMDGLTNCKDNDIIIISDIDEIPNAETVKQYKASDGIKRFAQDFYYYNFNCKSKDFWKEGKILTYGLLKQIGGPCQARYQQCEEIPNGGWHLSYFGNKDHIIKKIKSFAHREYNNEDIISQAEERIKNGQDLFGRQTESFHTIQLDDNLPKYVKDNVEKYKELGFIK